jgi:predicted short-subunit dehydrogenase-like oxidoreductase (DUF2520 family)
VSLRVAVIGAGRMGQGIALALSRSGASVTLLGRVEKPVPPPLTLRIDRWAEACALAEVVLIAVPDAAIGDVASQLLLGGAIRRDHAILHLSGLLDRAALEGLAPTGAGLGSFHPLQTVAEPVTAAERFRGAYAGVEGDAAAITAGERLAGLLGMTPVRIPPGAKVAYHVGATLVANYSVALVAIAVRLAEQAGIPPAAAARLYLPLLHGAADNLDRLAPAAALTGAIRRGDVGTVEAHLAVLRPADRVIYVALGREALALARVAGLAAGAADAVERVLEAGISGRRP